MGIAAQERLGDKPQPPQVLPQHLVTGVSWHGTVMLGIVIVGVIGVEGATIAGVLTSGGLLSGLGPPPL